MFGYYSLRMLEGQSYFIISLTSSSNEYLVDHSSFFIAFFGLPNNLSTSAGLKYFF